MPTTTAKAIRNNVITLVEAITPTTHANTKFRVNRAVADFGDWAENHATSCFRRFAIHQVGERGLPEIADHQEHHLERFFQLVVAYPKDSHSMIGREAMRDLDDVLEQDEKSICKAIGIIGQTNYVSGCSGVWVEDSNSTPGESAVLFAFELRTKFFRDMT